MVVRVTLEFSKINMKENKPSYMYIAHKISEDLQKMINELGHNYDVHTRIFNTTVIRNAKDVAIKAFTEIKGLKAKSLDGELELTIDFCLEHETPKEGNRVTNVLVFPDTRETRKRAIQDISVAYSKYKP